MATIEECREKLKSIIERIIKETELIYGRDYRDGNPNPVALIQEWAHEMEKDLGIDSHQAPHSILKEELKSRILHSTLKDFGTAIHRDKTSHGAFEDLPKTREYVYALLARWKPENLLKQIEFIFKRQELAQAIQKYLVKVESEGARVGLDLEMLKSWRRKAENVFITRTYIAGWGGNDDTSSIGLTVVNVDTEQEYVNLSKELEALIEAMVKEHKVSIMTSKERDDGSTRRTHKFIEHWTPEAILQRAKAHNRSRASSPSAHSHVALSLSVFSPRSRRS
ncbi:hypothetical protein JCM5353_004996 [Sporobolomyces roseus]